MPIIYLSLSDIQTRHCLLRSVSAQAFEQRRLALSHSNLQHDYSSRDEGYRSHYRRMRVYQRSLRLPLTFATGLQVVCRSDGDLRMVKPASPLLLALDAADELRDESFNSITGLNGSGKSNILDSICFVLGITNMSTVRAQNLQV